MRDINEIIIHHTDSDWGDVAEIRRWHTDKPPKGNGWRDIGYNYVILNGHRGYKSIYTAQEDGLLEVGRPIDQVGAHVSGHNAKSIGISLVGKKAFTEKQFSTLRRTINALKREYPITSIVGHNHYANTDCPSFDWQTFLKNQ